MNREKKMQTEKKEGKGTREEKQRIKGKMGDMEWGEKGERGCKREMKEAEEGKGRRGR